ncbi:hypothetical protein [Bacillus sp. JJ722]|uniref:hypothetical protein n=1 Tax=Bacillus sp. JJ722 TaxID=3122973 RepID=UPI0030008E97
MFGRKTEVMTVKEFMGRTDVVRQAHEVTPVLKGAKTSTSSYFNSTRKQITKIIVVTGATILSLGFGDPTLAAAGAVNAAITERVVNAFDPLIALVQALSYPIGLTVMLCGGIFLMLGNADRGLTMIQRAGAGYIAVQLLPMLMDLLVEIAKAL